MTTWLRPTCTLLIKKLVSCNSAAYHVNLAVESTCQGTDHILGKCHHLRAVAIMEDKPLRIDGLKDLLQMIWREDMFVKNLQHSSRTGQHIHEGRLLSSRRHTVIRCVSDCPFFSPSQIVHWDWDQSFTHDLYEAAPCAHACKPGGCIYPSTRSAI